MLSPFPFQELHTWYLECGRHDLPWRDYTLSEKELGYRVWLAEIMLQQTQVERVREYFTRILTAFPTVESLAATDYEAFFPYYKGLGYYSRARNMLAAAQSVVEDFSGVFPRGTSELLTLPGVGPYTAEAIRAFGYDIATLSFDTNLEKIFSRYYFGNKYQKLSREHKSQILTDFQNTGISGRDINNALMDFGSLISLNAKQKIIWEDYPLTNSEFYKTRGSLEPEHKKKISSFPTRDAEIYVILHENHTKYFSSSDVGDFSVFSIGKNTGDPRALSKAYFLKHYHLEVSVRPPEVKSYLGDGTPYLVSYVQIQSGTHKFQEHQNITIRGNEESLVEKINN